MKIRPGIRTKLFFISVAMILLMAVVSGLWLELHLETWLEFRIETKLGQHAKAVADLIELSPPSDSTESWDLIADRIGGDISARITIFNSEGAVLGDSDIPTGAIPDAENHSDRPEFIDALNSGIGVSRRRSATVEVPMLYVAVPYNFDETRGVVRTAMPLHEVDIVISRLRAMIAIAGLIGLVVAAIMSGIASHMMSSTLRTIIESAKQITEGKARPRLDIPDRDEIGGLAGSINRLGDELEKTIGELGLERDQLESVLEGIDDAVIAVDGDLSITLLNTAAINLLALASAPVGRSLLDAIQVPALIELVTGHRPGEPASAEFELPGLPPKRVLAHITMQRKSSGRVIVMRDVTEVRKLEAARRDFFANASHELRTPIGIVQANAETLIGRASVDPEKTDEFLQAIHRNSVRLGKLIEDLLQISRIEEGKYPVNLEPEDIKTPILNTVNAITNLAREKNITITLEVPSDVRAEADRDALEEVLMNLLDNAVKYTPDTGQVTIRASETDTEVRIEIEDNGPGIPIPDRDRIFERFYRVDDGRSREMGGTGLGLAIVKHLVTAMGGMVSFEPSRPHGSKFIVTLRRAS